MPVKLTRDSLLPLTLVALALALLELQSFIRGQMQPAIIGIGLTAMLLIWLNVTQSRGMPKHFLVMTFGMFLFGASYALVGSNEDARVMLALKVVAALGWVLMIAPMFDVRNPGVYRRAISRLINRP